MSSQFFLQLHIQLLKMLTSIPHESPTTLFDEMLWRFWNFSSQPLEAAQATFKCAAATAALC